MLNHIILMGNLTADPKMKYTPDGVAITDFSIAVNEKYKDKEYVSFFNLVAFKKTAEIISEYFTKGSRIIIEGRLKQERWEKEGVARSVVKVLVDKIHFAGDKKMNIESKQENINEDEVPF